MSVGKGTSNLPSFGMLRRSSYSPLTHHVVASGLSGPVTGVRPYELPQSSCVVSKYLFNPALLYEEVQPAEDADEDLFTCVSPFAKDFNRKAASAPLMEQVVSIHLRQKQLKRNLPKGKPYET